MIDPLPTISSETLHQNPYFSLLRDQYRLPSGRSGAYHYVRSTGSVFVIPRTQRGSFLLVKQFRYLTQRVSIEFPGGGIGRGRSAEEAARAELEEEAGVVADSLELLGRFNPCNGLIDEVCSVFLATGLTASDAAELDEAEQIEVLTASAEQLRAWIRDGQIDDGMTLAAWSLLLAHHGPEER